MAKRTDPKTASEKRIDDDLVAKLARKAAAGYRRRQDAGAPPSPINEPPGRTPRGRP